MLVVAKPIFREDSISDIDDPNDSFERAWVKKKFDEIRRLTGCSLVLCEAQPEYYRPYPFYYITGNLWAVNQTTFFLQKMMLDKQTEKLEDLQRRLDIDRTWVLECAYIKMPSPWFCLYRSLDLIEDSTNEEMIEVLNSWCLEGTQVTKLGCIPKYNQFCKCSAQLDSYENVPACKDIHITGVLKEQVNKTRDAIISNMLVGLV